MGLVNNSASPSDKPTWLVTNGLKDTVKLPFTRNQHSALFPFPPVQVVKGGECRVGGGRVQGEEPEDVVCDGEGGGEAPAGRADRYHLHRGALTHTKGCTSSRCIAPGKVCHRGCFVSSYFAGRAM